MNQIRSMNALAPSRKLARFATFVFGFAGLSLSGTLLGQTSKADTPPTIDPATGMIMSDDWELVRNTCIVCHSPQTFLRQRGTETTWREIIAWMQQSGGLAPLPDENKEKIVAYLTINYGPGETYRRAPIPATLMPDNPYISETRKAWIQSQQ